MILQHPPTKVCAAERNNMTRLQSSRDNWKLKTKSLRRLIKNSSRQMDRLRVALASSKAREKLITEERDELAQQLRLSRLIKPIPQQSTTILLSVLLVLNARISFRATPRALSCLKFHGRIPHFSSVINWVCRVGLASLRYIKPPDEPWIAIVDMTLDIAFTKALVVLRVPVSIYLRRKGAITLEDVSCAGVVVGKTWKSPDIARALHGMLGDGGSCKAIIKDGANDLAKAVSLWKEEAKREDVAIISDISHEAANAIRKDFDTKESFKNLKERLNKTGTKIFQSSISYLAPPRLRVKGRYMAISRLGRWFGRIQVLLDGVSLAEKGSVVFELRRLFGGMGNLREVAADFCEKSTLLSDVMKILKVQGLNSYTFDECMKKIQSLPEKSNSRNGMEAWLRKHIAVQRQLNIDETPLVVTSDIIESLFGTFKHLLARNPRCELNHMILAMPALCGPMSEARIRQQIGQVSQKDFEEWKKREIKTTGRAKRKQIMADADVQISEQKLAHLKCG